MKNIILLFIVILGYTNVYGQDLIFPNAGDLKKGDTFIKFESNKRNAVNVTKVLQNLSSKDIKEIQSKLKDLGYVLNASGVLNETSEIAILGFNKKECGIQGYCITERTISILDKLHKKHLKEKRKAARKAKRKL